MEEREAEVAGRDAEDDMGRDIGGFKTDKLTQLLYASLYQKPEMIKEMVSGKAPTEQQVENIERI